MQGRHSRNDLLKLSHLEKGVKAMSVTTCPLITNEVVILTLQDLDPSSCHEVQKKKKKVFGVLQYSCVSCKTSS